MPSAQALAREHHRRQAAVTAAAVLAARRAAKSGRSLTGQVTAVAAAMVRYQLLSATTAANTLAAQHAGPAAASPVAFAGVTSMGYPVSVPLTTILDRYTRATLAKSSTLANQFAYQLDRFVASEVADAGRSASQVEVVANRQWSGFVRLLDLPSCSRCVPLAGRVYRYSQEFDRHDLCDCQMWPVEDEAQATAEGLVTDPIQAIEDGQVRGLSKADRQAILDGADVNQVINAHRGMRTVNLFGREAKITLEGTTKRGWYGGHTEKGRSGYVVEKIGRYGYVKNQARRRSTAPRLRPETIYAHAESREDAIRLLRIYGYILPTSSS